MVKVQGVIRRSQDVRRDKGVMGYKLPWRTRQSRHMDVEHEP